MPFPLRQIITAYLKADRLTITLSILAIIFAALLYYLGLCVPDIEFVKRPWPFNHESMNSLYAILCNKRLEVSLLVLLLIILFHIISYISVENDKKKWLRAFLKHVIQQDLDGNQFETRITIFREQRGWKFLPKYVWRCITKRKDFWKRIINMPNPFKKYLFPYIRYSFPNSTPSTSYFKISKSNSDNVDSIASMCYKKGISINCNTSYIQDIQLPKDRNKLSKEDNAKVKKYMRDSYMDNYEKLRLIDRRANHLYAVLIQRDEETTDVRWGVIVFDKNSNNPDDLGEKLNDVIYSYLKITQFSIKIIR